jgi:hypothetical protein
MIWSAIFKKSKLSSFIVDSGVIIDQHYYIKYVLQAHRLQNAQLMYGEDFFCFQQDSAPYFKATRIQKW